jgi:hypothetical protein
MKTIFSSVGFQDETGTPLSNGSIVLRLIPPKPMMDAGAIYRVISGAGQVFSNSFIINLDAAAKIPAAIQVWASDELTTNPLYSATLCSSANGISPVASIKWLISGTSPIDLSLLPQR